jgi:large subunit ribosomal protein L24
LYQLLTLEQADVKVPEFLLHSEVDKRPVRSLELPLPLTSVRLVHALTDPETGVTRDVIVKKVVNSRIWFDKHTGVRRWSRIIPGLNVKIPWPKTEPREYKDYEIDTLRADVEKRTWVPTLLTPPMPETVIDELRNKYSVFRHRHDEEYVAKKMAEDEEKAKKKSMVEMMRTPLKEANRRERRERKKKGKGTLTREMLVRIGEVMAKKALQPTAPPQVAAA